jgi:Inorganic Pyrophosphatase
MAFDVDAAKQAGYSDSDIAGFMAQQNPNFDYQGAKKAGYSDAEIAGHLSGIEAQPSLGSDIGNDVESNIAAEEGVLTSPQFVGSKLLQTAGNIAGTGYDIAGDIAKRIPGYGYVKQGAQAVGNLAQQGAQGIANAIDSPETEQAAVNAATSSRDFINSHPELVANTQAVGKLLPLEGVVGDAGKAIDALNKFTDPLPQDILPANTPAPSLPKIAVKNILPDTQDILNGRGVPDQAIAAMTPAQITKLKNGMYAEGVAGSIQDAQKIKSGIYSMANEVGNDDVFNAADTKSQLDNLHAQYSNDPQYAQSPLVKRLNNWRAMFDNDGTITPSRLNALQDQVDDAFRENPKSPDGAVYSAIQSPVKEAMNAAKQQFPNWGTLIDTADDAHYNLLKSTQDDSAFTKKWSPDSQKDFQIVANKSNNPADLMGDTQRQIANLANIKDEAELQKIMAFMPKELQTQFLTDVSNNSRSPLNVMRFAKSLLYSAKGNIGWGVENMAASLPTKADIASMEPDAATHISDRMQAYKDAADQSYQNHYAQKQESQAAKWAANEAAKPPEPLPPIPSGNTPFPKDINAPMTSQLSPSERMQTAGNVYQRVANKPATPALDAAKQTLQNLAQGKPAAAPVKTNSMSEAFPDLSEQLGRNATNYSNAEYQQMLQMGYSPAQLKAMGYKRGGAVQPTPAQREAGNYKKDHIKIHGLDIAVETRKGAIRHGKGWQSVSPADYGYIKRTEGADGEHVDCYVGSHPKSNRIYIINQHHLDGNWDEHKVMIAFPSRDEAIATYKAGFSDGSGKQRIGSVTRMSVQEFKNWLSSGNTKKPIKKAA